MSNWLLYKCVRRKQQTAPFTAALYIVEVILCSVIKAHFREMKIIWWLVEILLLLLRNRHLWHIYVWHFQDLYHWYGLYYYIYNRILPNNKFQPHSSRRVYFFQFYYRHVKTRQTVTKYWAYLATKSRSCHIHFYYDSSQLLIWFMLFLKLGFVVCLVLSVFSDNNWLGIWDTVELMYMTVKTGGKTHCWKYENITT
jgi:hypothetical protein